MSISGVYYTRRIEINSAESHLTFRSLWEYTCRHRQRLALEEVEQY